MREPNWLSIGIVLKIHDRAIASSDGGLPGIKSPGLLESAIERPRNLHYYERLDDRFDLAAAYMVAIAKAHAFNDANKRAAFGSGILFLFYNGIDVVPDKDETYEVMHLVADSKMDRLALADWLRKQPRF